jgi:hypothetical protein
VSPQEIEAQAIKCSGFWATHPNANICPNHVQTPTAIEIRQPNNAVPQQCPTCSLEMVESPEGHVPGFYGRLIFALDPPNPTCPNCGTALVSVHQDLSSLRVAA